MKRLLLTFSAATALLGTACKQEAPPASSFECQADKDCQVSCERRGSCCGEMCTCSTAFHVDELAAVRKANRANCGDDVECPEATCLAPKVKYEARCQERRCKTVEVPLEQEGP